MKKLTTLIFFLLAINCYSQITTIVRKEKEEPVEVQKYDSLESLNYGNVPLHVGQTLFIKGDSESKEDGFYNQFYTKIIPKKIYYEVNGDNYIYKPIKSTINSSPVILSNYSELAGKYYKVLSIETELSIINEVIYWIKLIGDDNVSFYCKVSEHRGTTQFVTLGYYEKMKQTFVGKEFYSKGTSSRQKVDSEETVKLPLKTKFKCTDIAIKMGEDEPIFAVLENDRYGKIKGKIIEGRRLHMFVSISAYNEYIKKYGAKFGVHVANSRVEIGMNKKMVLDAWGAPKDINTTQGSFGVHEQWVYNGSYLYFENGKLTSIQN